MMHVKHDDCDEKGIMDMADVRFNSVMSLVAGDDEAGCTPHLPDRQPGSEVDLDHADASPPDMLLPGADETIKMPTKAQGRTSDENVL